MYLMLKYRFMLGLISLASIIKTGNSAPQEENCTETPDTENPLIADPGNGTEPELSNRFWVFAGAVAAAIYTFGVPTDVSKVKFVYYGQTGSSTIEINNAISLPGIGFQRGRPLKMIIHGFQNDQSTPFPSQMISAFRSRRVDFNLMVVDWGLLAAIKFLPTAYPEAADNVQRVGDHVANFIKFLEKDGGIDLANVHLIGHSLGAHVCGVAGYKLKGKLGRITGLDPAGPKFKSLQKRTHERLSPDDAKFVDVIHTDSIFGTDLVTGHVDFYPNGGKQQEDCTPTFVNPASSCNHARAHEMYTNTVSNPKKYKACPCGAFQKCATTCTDFVYVGIDLPHTTRGSYYFVE